MSKQTLHPLTEKINTQQKAKAKQSRIKALHWLAKTFPHAFDNAVSIHPLKIGIMNDILAHANSAAAIGISKSKLREAVILHTRKIDYLTCLKAREIRIDLDGNPTLLVTEAEAEQAAVKIKAQIEKNTKFAQKNTVDNGVSSPSTSKNGVNDTHYEKRFAATTPVPVRTTPIIIKHKTNKSYDPDAVARLKEKLGLSRHPESDLA